MFDLLEAHVMAVILGNGFNEPSLKPRGDCISLLFKDLLGRHDSSLPPSRYG